MKAEDLVGQKIGSYTLRKVIGKGGFATVFLANVDLDAFDYDTLIAHRAALIETIDTRKTKGYVSREDEFKEIDKKAQELKQQNGLAQKVITVMKDFPDAFPSEGVAAVKVLNLASDLFENKQQDYMERFESEWRLLMGINHPNVITVYGGGTEEVNGEPVHFYSMECLEHILGKKQLILKTTQEQKIEIIKQAALGLQEIHSFGLIHRDVKLDNILVTGIASQDKTEIDNVEISDMGTAKDVMSDGKTMEGTVIGTPRFMSPEQAKGVSQDIDPRTDIYSLGVVAYTMLTRKLPFKEHSSNALKIINALQSKERPTPMNELDDRIPQGIVSVVEKMMEPEREQRYKSMQEVADALDNLKEDKKRTVVSAPESVYELKEEIPAGKSRLKWYIIGAAALALGAIGGAVFLGGNEKPNNNTSVEEKDFSHINDIYSSLEDNYSPEKHQELIQAADKVPKARKEEFESLLEKADLLEDDYELDRFKKMYTALERDPTNEGISRLMEKYEELDKKPEVDFDGLSDIVNKYAQARSLVDECQEMVDSSEDMRYIDEIEQKKQEALKLINSTEQVKDYRNLFEEIQEIELGERPTLVFKDQEDLEYLQQVLQADGRVENGRFVGKLKLQGICSFDFNGQIDDQKVQGPCFYNGEKLNTGDEVYEVDTVEGEFDNLMVYKQ